MEVFEIIYWKNKLNMMKQTWNASKWIQSIESVLNAFMLSVLISILCLFLIPQTLLPAHLNVTYQKTDWKRSRRTALYCQAHQRVRLAPTKATNWSVSPHPPPSVAWVKSQNYIFLKFTLLYAEGIQLERSYLELILKAL